MNIFLILSVLSVAAFSNTSFSSDDSNVQTLIHSCTGRQVPVGEVYDIFYGRKILKLSYASSNEETETKLVNSALKKIAKVSPTLSSSINESLQAMNSESIYRIEENIEWSNDLVKKTNTKEPDCSLNIASIYDSVNDVTIVGGNQYRSLTNNLNKAALRFRAAALRTIQLKNLSASPAQLIRLVAESFSTKEQINVAGFSTPQDIEIFPWEYLKPGMNLSYWKSENYAHDRDVDVVLEKTPQQSFGKIKVSILEVEKLNNLIEKLKNDIAFAIQNDFSNKKINDLKQRLKEATWNLNDFITADIEMKTGAVKQVQRGSAEFDISSAQFDIRIKVNGKVQDLTFELRYINENGVESKEVLKSSTMYLAYGQYMSLATFRFHLGIKVP